MQSHRPVTLPHSRPQKAQSHAQPSVLRRFAAQGYEACGFTVFRLPVAFAVNQATNWKGRQTRSTILPTTAKARRESRVTLKALDQSSRYADLSLDEATLIKRPSCKSESESTVLGLNFVHKDPAVR
ncbi:rbcL, partial [Symbiodinium microadriaticum]